MNDFKDKIHHWYSMNKRDLPWRKTRDPYKIWLSEIILQQTRIDQGLKYYLKFIDSFPSVFDLAQASEDEVIKLWQGLGYYSRARNLHATSRHIVKQYNGVFPNHYEDIINLKGIGEYTAAAITSISFNQPYPTLDGNVYRVLSRYFGIGSAIDSGEGKKIFTKLALELMDHIDPGMHNQAIMEFGALQCTPQKPDCNECLLNSSCFAHLKGEENKFPVKKNKTKQKDRYFNYIILSDKEKTYIRKRTKNDIWMNLFEFPLIETTDKLSIEKLLLSEAWNELLNPFNPFSLESHTAWGVHILSHQRINYRFVLISVQSEKKITTNLIQVYKKDIFNFAVPKLIETFINNNNWI